MGVKQALSFLGKGFIWQVQAVSFRECKLSALTCLRFSQRRWRRRRRLCDVQLSEDFMIFLHENFEDDGESKSYRREISDISDVLKEPTLKKNGWFEWESQVPSLHPSAKCWALRLAILKDKCGSEPRFISLNPPATSLGEGVFLTKESFGHLAGSSTWEKYCNLWCRAKNDFKRLWKCEAPVGNLVSVRCFTRKMWFQKIWFQKNICSW